MFPDPNKKIPLGFMLARDFMERHGNKFVQECKEILENYKLDVIQAIENGEYIPYLKNVEWYAKLDGFLFNEITGDFGKWLNENHLRLSWKDTSYNTLFVEYDRRLSYSQIEAHLNQPASSKPIQTPTVTYDPNFDASWISDMFKRFK